MLDKGRAQNDDPVNETFDLVQDLIKRGIPAGYYGMGRYLENGYGVEEDQELAFKYFRKAEIKADPNFYMVLELISDHDSILSYLSYVGLAIEAIPPNFLGYLAAKGGAYLLIELVLLLVTALLSAGAAAAARIAGLAARLLASGGRLANAAKKIEHAREALESVVRVVNDFYEATISLRALGDKLRVARQRGLVLRGKTRTTIPARKQNIKRQPKCQLCGSTKHTTPRHRLGTVTY